MARIAGALAAVVLAALLVWTVVAAFGPDPVIVPAGGVTDRGPNDAVPTGPEAQLVLRQRAMLQDWRGVSGPSPGNPADAVVRGQPVSNVGPETDPRKLVQEWLASEHEFVELLRGREFVAGTVNLPDPKAGVLEQPQGRDWRRLHNGQVVFGGGIIIFGFSFLLAMFLAIRGRIRLERGFSGLKMGRFSLAERVNHWVTAASFLILALTGLLLLYGQFFLKPLVGAGGYSQLAEISAYLHIAFALPLVAGVLLMTVFWIGQNWFTWVDFRWLAKGGGLVSDSAHKPSAYKFNAGQKLIFWIVLLGTVVLFASGLSLVFPFYWLDISGMQWAQLIHAAASLGMIAIIIGHIYIGTVGMEGAFEGMWSGTVDRNWAEEHHDLWVARLDAEEKAAPRAI